MESETRDASERKSAHSAAASTRRTDVIVIGAGLAGTCAATALSRNGYDVVLIEATATVPPTLRAEKLDGAILDLFERIGLADIVRAAATPIYSLWIARYGQLMTRRFKREYGFSYNSLITTLRAALPAAVDLRIARITQAESGPDRQRVTLADGSAVEGRLLVLATGHGDALRRRLGIEGVAVQSDHSLCIGFFLKTPRGRFPFESLIYGGERREDRVAYLSLFPIGTRMRANLFVYRTHAEPWTRAFRENPAAMLRQTLPNLEALSGPIEIDEPVDIRPIDLRIAENHARDGVVLIGDAFCTSCPISGTGMRKALIDVDRLCHEHVPAWFATPGMNAEKIARFYADPVKTSFDADSLRMSEALRGITVGEGRRWALRRIKNTCRTQVSFAMHRGAHIAASVLGTIVSLI